VHVAPSVVWRASQRRGVEWVAAWGGGEADEGEGEKVAAAARGENGRRLCEGGILPY
jgi:hypothetical protein